MIGFVLKADRQRNIRKTSIRTNLSDDYHYDILLQEKKKMIFIDKIMFLNINDTKKNTYSVIFIVRDRSFFFIPFRIL
jgi:hypothetical protein